MPAAKSSMSFVGVQAPPVQQATPQHTACVLTRRAAMEKAAQSMRQLNDLLGCVTRELAEGDLDLADLIVPSR